MSDVDGHGLQGLAPGEGEQPLHQRSGAIGRLRRARDEALLALAAEPLR